MVLSIRVLGKLSVADGATDCTPTRPQSLHLLGLLAADPFAWVTTDVLSHDLRSSALTQAARRLRQEIGSSTVAHQSRSYRLDPEHCTIDLATWTESIARAEASEREGDKVNAVALYREARDLWRGPAFDGIVRSLQLDDASERLRQRRIKVESQEARLLSETGDPEASELFAALVAYEPLREDLVVGLVDALRGSDRRVEAAREAAAFRERLAETGMTPTDGFVEVESRVHSPESGRVGRGGPHAGARSLGLRSGPHLSDAIAAGAIACLQGERQPMLRLLTPAGFDSSHALWLAIEKLRSGDQTVVVTRPPATGLYSIRLALPTTVVEPGAGRADEEHETITRWSSHGADHPTVLVVTDTEQLDDWSQSLLKRLANAPAGNGLCVITIGLDNESEIDHGPDPLALPRLSRDEIADVVRLRLGDQIDEGGIELVTDQFVQENRSDRLGVEHQITSMFSITNALPDEAITPEQRGRFVLLPNGTHHMLGRAACLGPAFDHVLLAAATGQEPADVLAALSPAISTGFLDGPDVTGKWRFAIPPTYELALGSLLVPEQMTVQLAAGRFLADRPGRRQEAAELLLKSVAIADRSEVGEVLAAAGEEVAAGGAYREASELFEQAVTFAESSEVEANRTLRLAEMLELCGDHEDASVALDRVVDLSIELDDHSLLAAAALHGTGRGSRIGGLADRRRRLAVAYGRVPIDQAQRDAVTVEFAIELFSARCPLSADLEARLHEIAETVESPVRAPAARVTLVREEIMVGAGIEKAQNVARLVLESPELPPAAATACFATAIHVALSAGHFVDAEHWIAELYRLGEKTGTPRAKWQSRVFSAALLGAQGDTAQSDVVAQEALGLGKSLRLDDAMATYGFQLAGPAIADRSLGGYLSVLDQADERYDFPIWHALRGLAHLDAGHDDAAGEMIGLILRGLDDGTDFFRCGTLAMLALLGTRLNDTPALVAADAALSARRNRFIFVGYGGPCLGPIASYQALVAGALGRESDQFDFERQAEEACRFAGARKWSVG